MNNKMRTNVLRFFKTAYINPMTNISTYNKFQMSYDDLKESLEDYILSSNLNPTITEPIPEPDNPSVYIVAMPSDYGSAFILHLDGTVEFYYFNKLFDDNDSDKIKIFKCKVNDKKINDVFGSSECNFCYFKMAYELSNGLYQFLDHNEYFTLL